MRRPSTLSPIGIYRVSGDSMLPTYAPGDTLVGLRWFKPKVGQVVIARHEGRPIIKRLTKIEPEGYWLVGDNEAHSTDSRSLGYLPKNAIEARVVLRL